ncbi:NADH-quinone oxidoreductase subunit N [Anaerosinus massiliensis]|uniref:NADH-quinone oxidoreductase subunit N n=1 Tax=Massilibacillus massiliensis TaxID=1806837 RepID=UPI000A5CD5C6|nr:NADH-quinone oxidoreductase subunit N [Massilibacillus massiliensis]
MNIELLAVEIAVVVLALALIMFDLLLPRQENRRSLGCFTVCGLIGILLYSFQQYGISDTVYREFFVVDSFAVFFKQVFLVGTILTVAFSFDTVEKFTKNIGEFYALLLFGLAGMMVMVSANDLLTVFIGLELMSIAFYSLVGFHLKSVKSSEAGIKYLILGATASAVFLYGVSWVYGFSGSILFGQLALQLNDSPAVLLGVGLILAGLCFKISVVPFHMWAPDVYEGAPISVTAMLAMASKAAGFAVVVRVFLVAFIPLQMYWQPVISILAGLSMLVGIVGAIWQKNMKRMLAYSSIAQAGYILAGLVAADGAGAKGMLVYIVLYMAANVGAFAVIAAVYNQCGADEIEDFSGLSQTSPFLAVVMTVSLLSMAGLPPLAGFVGKLYIFTAIADKGYFWLAVLGLVFSMISVYYYMLVVKTMYGKEAKETQVGFHADGTLRIVALFSLVATLFIGIYPRLLAELANAAVQALY